MKGHYRTLGLAGFFRCDSMQDKQMTSLSALEIFDACIVYPNICHLTQLKQLHVVNLKDGVDSNAISVNLKDLERLFIGECSVEQLKPFFRYTKLKMVFIRNVSNNALNFFNLNRTRRMGGIQSWPFWRVLFGNKIERQQCDLGFSCNYSSRIHI